MKAFLAGCLLGLGIIGAFHTEVDFQSINVGTNSTYCGFDFDHANAYCEHAS